MDKKNKKHINPVSVVSSVEMESATSDFGHSNEVWEQFLVEWDQYLESTGNPPRVENAAESVLKEKNIGERTYLKSDVSRSMDGITDVETNVCSSVGGRVGVQLDLGSRVIVPSSKGTSEVANGTESVSISNRVLEGLDNCVQKNVPQGRTINPISSDPGVSVKSGTNCTEQLPNTFKGHSLQPAVTPNHVNRSFPSEFDFVTDGEGVLYIQVDAGSLTHSSIKEEAGVTSSNPYIVMPKNNDQLKLILQNMKGDIVGLKTEPLGLDRVELDEDEFLNHSAQNSGYVSVRRDVTSNIKRETTGIVIENSRTNEEEMPRESVPKHREMKCQTRNRYRYIPFPPVKSEKVLQNESQNNETHSTPFDEVDHSARSDIQKSLDDNRSMDIQRIESHLDEAVFTKINELKKIVTQMHKAASPEEGRTASLLLDGATPTEIQRSVPTEIQRYASQSDNSVPTEIQSVSLSDKSVPTDIQRPVSQSVNSVPTEIQRPVSQSGNSVPTEIQSVSLSDKSVPTDIQRPVSQSGNSVPTEIQRPVSQSGNSVPTDIQRPVSQSGNSVPSDIKRPVSQSGNSVPTEIQRPVSQLGDSVPNDIQRPVSQSGNSVPNDIQRPVSRSGNSVPNDIQRPVSQSDNSVPTEIQSVSLSDNSVPIDIQRTVSQSENSVPSDIERPVSQSGNSVPTDIQRPVSQSGNSVPTDIQRPVSQSGNSVPTDIQRPVSQSGNSVPLSVSLSSQNETSVSVGQLDEVNHKDAGILNPDAHSRSADVRNTSSIATQTEQPVNIKLEPSEHNVTLYVCDQCDFLCYSLPRLARHKEKHILIKTEQEAIECVQVIGRVNGKLVQSQGCQANSRTRYVPKQMTRVKTEIDEEQTNSQESLDTRSEIQRNESAIYKTITSNVMRSAADCTLEMGVTSADESSDEGNEEDTGLDDAYNADTDTCTEDPCDSPGNADKRQTMDVEQSENLCTVSARSEKPTAMKTIQDGTFNRVPLLSTLLNHPRNTLPQEKSGGGLKDGLSKSQEKPTGGKETVSNKLSHLANLLNNQMSSPSPGRSKDVNSVQQKRVTNTTSVPTLNTQQIYSKFPSDFTGVGSPYLHNVQGVVGNAVNLRPVSDANRLEQVPMVMNQQNRMVHVPYLHNVQGVVGNAVNLRPVSDANQLEQVPMFINQQNRMVYVPRFQKNTCPSSNLQQTLHGHGVNEKSPYFQNINSDGAAEQRNMYHSYLYSRSMQTAPGLHAVYGITPNHLNGTTATTQKNLLMPTVRNLLGNGHAPKHSHAPIEVHAPGSNGSPIIIDDDSSDSATEGSRLESSKPLPQPRKDASTGLDMNMNHILSDTKNSYSSNSTKEGSLHGPGSNPLIGAGRQNASGSETLNASGSETRVNQVGQGISNGSIHLGSILNGAISSCMTADNCDKSSNQKSVCFDLASGESIGAKNCRLDTSDTNCHGDKGTPSSTSYPVVSDANLARNISMPNNEQDLPAVPGVRLSINQGTNNITNTTGNIAVMGMDIAGKSHVDVNPVCSIPSDVSWMKSAVAQICNAPTAAPRSTGRGLRKVFRCDQCSKNFSCMTSLEKHKLECRTVEIQSDTEEIQGELNDAEKGPNCVIYSESDDAVDDDFEPDAESSSASEEEDFERYYRSVWIDSDSDDEIMDLVHPRTSLNDSAKIGKMKNLDPSRQTVLSRVPASNQPTHEGNGHLPSAGGISPNLQQDTESQQPSVPRDRDTSKDISKKISNVLKSRKSMYKNICLVDPNNGGEETEAVLHGYCCVRNPTEYWCEECDEVLKDKNDVEAHLISKHGFRLHEPQEQIEVACDICCRKFKTKINLLRHNIIVHGTYMMILQGKGGNRRLVKRKRGRMLLVTADHKERKFICAICDTIADGSNEMTKHMKEHESDKRFQIKTKRICKFCEALFPTPLLCLKHETYNHSSYVLKQKEEQKSTDTNGELAESGTRQNKALDGLAESVKEAHPTMSPGEIVDSRQNDPNIELPQTCENLTEKLTPTDHPLELSESSVNEDKIRPGLSEVRDVAENFESGDALKHTLQPENHWRNPIETSTCNSAEKAMHLQDADIAVLKLSDKSVQDPVIEISKFSEKSVKDPMMEMPEASEKPGQDPITESPLASPLDPVNETSKSVQDTITETPQASETSAQDPVNETAQSSEKLEQYTSKNSCPVPGLSDDELSVDEFADKHTVVVKGRFDELFLCKFCEIQNSFTEKGNYRLHLMIHSPNWDIVCPGCDLGFKSQKYLQLHLERCLREHLFVCHVCGKTLLNKKKFRYHLRNHNRRKRLENGESYKCKCGKIFMTQARFQSHFAEFHENGEELRHHCTECFKSFTVRLKMVKHMQKHKEEEARPFNCDKCESAFKVKHHLQNHIDSIHSDKRKFECNVCDSKFSLKHQLQSHMRLHTGDLYKCEYCDKKVASKAQLNIHVRNHHPENADFYTCKVCNQEFTKLRLLNDHIKMHEKNKLDTEGADASKNVTKEGTLLWCDICNDKFTGKYYLKNHMNSVHSADNGSVDGKKTAPKRKIIKKAEKDLEVGKLVPKQTTGKKDGKTGKGKRKRKITQDSSSDTCNDFEETENLEKEVKDSKCRRKSTISFNYCDTNDEFEETRKLQKEVRKCKRKTVIPDNTDDEFEETANPQKEGKERKSKKKRKQ
jgi:hypothetical protein